MLSTIQSQKRTLRKSMSTALRSLDPSYVNEQSRAIAAKVSLLPVFQDCNNLSCFLSMPSGEVDTSGIVADVLASGNKSLFVPKVSQNGSMESLKVHNRDDLDTLTSGLWGIREPSDEWEGKPPMDVVLDLILVPGVAFDRSMSRLGHGKGYYDRYIARYIANGRPHLSNFEVKRPAVALAFREQLLDSSIPTSEHDCKMDVIVTPDEVVMV
ncbi:hypothetical protein GYMLUDRAFT_154066 [Collybiopsis luxurians FD-317 M1]|nr:hypothetical protein GYMLUDRAFT_154066 [Collybiopsis luxurians FD-317 M1]